MLSFLRQAWLVLILSVGFGVALAAVQRSLDPRIERNRLERRNNAIRAAVPGGQEITEQEVDGAMVYRVMGADGVLAGWGVEAETMGFQDKVQVLIGLSPDASTITGLEILYSNETPGLGDKIYGEFRTQFRNQPAAASFTVVKAGETAEHPIHAITGATISSKAVTNAVMQELARRREAMAAAARAPAPPAAPSTEERP